MSRTLVHLFLVSWLLAPIGCKRHAAPAQPSASSHPAVADSAATQRRGAGDGSGATAGGGDDDEASDSNGTGNRRHVPTIYIDGKAVLAFAYNELPPGAKVSERIIPGDTPAENIHYQHVNFAGLLKSLGVDLRTVKAVHFHGGLDRVAVLDGNELRRSRDRLFINFAGELMGKPRVEWVKGIKTNDTPDTIRDLAIYVNKKPPRWNADEASLQDDQGNFIEGIPYAQPTVRGGVRVNVDGRWVTTIKRNLLEGNLTPVNADQPSQPPRYALLAFLAKNQIQIDQVRGIDLVTRDERTLRLSAEEAAGGLTFAALPDMGGAVMAYFGKHYAPCSAINVFSRVDAPIRPMRTVTLGATAAGWGQASHAAAPQVRGRR